MLRIPKFWSVVRRMSSIGMEASCAPQPSKKSKKNTERPKKMKINVRKIPSNISVSIIGNGSTGSPQCVLINAENAYMFNCGESTQKFLQGKRTLTKLKNIFFTSCHWRNIGGLIGFMLSSNSYAASLDRITFHGDERIAKLFDMTSYMRKPMIPSDMSGEPVLDDGLVKVTKISFERPDGTMYAYTCDFADKPGTLNIEKCLQLSVPAGPLLALLKDGQEVTLPDGKVVKPSEVLGKSCLGPVVVIIECPDADLLAKLEESPELRVYQEGAALKRPICLTHMTPRDVYMSEEYQKFCGKFSKHAVHMNLCEDNPPSQNEKAYRKQTHLNFLHPEIFPLLPEDPRVRGVKAWTNVVLRPDVGLKMNEIEETNRDACLEEMKTFPDFPDIQAKLQKAIASLDTKEERQYPEIVFLGTGSQQPLKDRNASGILVTVSEGHRILLDCGEATWTQLVDHYGIEGAKKIVTEIKAIYVSHKHPDHHMGLIGVLLHHDIYNPNERVMVIAPTPVLFWLKTFSLNYQPLNYDSFDNNDLMSVSQGPTGELLDVLDVSNIETCLVPHCPHSYGVRLTTNGYSVVYSGDTKPSHRLVELGKDCDLLIHEATFEDSMEDQAKYKSHSTAGQAIDIGKQMRAKFVLLTHFSQRYAKLPYIENPVSENNVGYAFDHMRVNPRLLPVLPLLYPALASIFHESMEVMKVKGIKRMRAINAHEAFLREAAASAEAD